MASSCRLLPLVLHCRSKSNGLQATTRAVTTFASTSPTSSSSSWSCCRHVRCPVSSRHCANGVWCRRWFKISRRSLMTSSRHLSPSLSTRLAKEHHDLKEAKESQNSRDSKETKDTKSSKGSKKHSKEKGSTLTTPEVIVEYYRGLPRITLPLPSRPQKCMFTLKPITQTVGDFLDMLKLEDPAVVEASVTTPAGIKMGATNRIETLLMDDFHLVINDKVYPVSPPPPIEAPKENLRQLRDLQALISQLYDTFNAREYHAELEREVMLHLEEVKVELEPLEQMRVELEEAGARRSHLATYVALGMMSFQFGFLARLVFWEYSWDVMEPITYFVTYATAMGCYMYFIATRQEYTLPDVFHREHLIGFHKKAKKKGFDLDRYNMLKDEAYELETMLRIIRGPLHHHQCTIEQKRRERLEKSRSSSSSPSSSPSSSRSPSPTRSGHDRSNTNVKKDSKDMTSTGGFSQPLSQLLSNVPKTRPTTK